MFLVDSTPEVADEYFVIEGSKLYFNLWLLWDSVFPIVLMFRYKPYSIQLNESVPLVELVKEFVLIREELGQVVVIWVLEKAKHLGMVGKIVFIELYIN